MTLTRSSAGSGDKSRPPAGHTARVDINDARTLMDAEAKANFWSRIDKRAPAECWHWTAGKLPNGYGMAAIRSVTQLAHRLAYVLANGPIPEGMVVRHLCDVRGCCNPRHLAVGTYADNEADKRRPKLIPKDEAELISIEVAAQKYAIDADQLKTAIDRNSLMDPIGSLAAGLVYDDSRLARFVRLFATGAA